MDEAAITGVLLLVRPDEVSVFADANIVLYNHASETSDTIAILRGDEIITRVRGRNRAGNWLALDLAGGLRGWVPATQVTTSVNLDRLTILEN